MNPTSKPPHDELTRQRIEHAVTFARTGNLPRRLGLTLSEALVIGLLRQGVKTYFAVLGHGSTEMGEVLRIYQDAGVVRVYGLRSEIEASHAAAALRWVTNEKAAVVTSIGPGALQALAASLVPASDGIGVWYLFGDETTEDEGFNHAANPQARAGALSTTGFHDGTRLQLAHSAGAFHCPPARCGDGGSPLSPRPIHPSPANEYASRLAARFQPGRIAC